jgi:hypothetical protein
VAGRRAGTGADNLELASARGQPGSEIAGRLVPLRFVSWESADAIATVRVRDFLNRIFARIFVIADEIFSI